MAALKFTLIQLVYSSLDSLLVNNTAERDKFRAQHKFVKLNNLIPVEVVNDTLVISF